MANLFVARRNQRKALYLPMGGTKLDPSIVVPLYKIDRSELDEIARAHLAEQGITDEASVQELVDEAEKQYEERVKVEEARKELRRLMQIRKQGGKLMSVANKKWKQAFYRPIGGK
ncbi:hypothetical protein CMI37_31830 [Candidatus Pacearchaeota archaeon]|nr:hypothetical protein [Candidatus Pacearchaeota archaeon]